MATRSSRHRPAREILGVVPSVVPGVRWPGVPSPPAATILALHDQLSQSQWWPAARLRAMQLGQLTELLAHARRTVPHYERHLPRAGRLTWKAFRSLPILTRATVQEDPATLVSRAVPTAHGATGDIRSSGSTGRPVELKATHLTISFRQALYLREHVWQGRDFRQTVAAIRNLPDSDGMPPHGTLTAGWVPAYSTAPTVALNIRATVDEQLRWLERMRPAYLVTFPTNLRALLLRALETGFALPGPRQVSTFAEPVPPGLRELTWRVLAAPLSDIYSAEETGPMAFQCGVREGYHVQSEHLIVEVVDEAGRPCRPGTVGRVIVTDLHNFATPLIRYEIGDVAEPGPPCPCGRELPVLSRVLGRARNMLRLPGGHQRWPSLPSGDVLGRMAPVRQFQLAQTGPAALVLRLVVARPLTADEEATVHAAFLADLGEGFALRIAYVDSIPRMPSGKYEDVRVEF